MNEIRVRDLLLDALTFSSGSIDAISFLALDKVFTAFMTANIVTATIAIRERSAITPQDGILRAEVLAL